jgi:hypothetical protein
MNMKKSDYLIERMESLQMEMRNLGILLKDAGYDDMEKDLISASDILGGWIVKVFEAKKGEKK